MSLSAIEDELLGVAGSAKSFVKVVASSAKLADGVEAGVGMTVYFTAEGVKKVVDDLLKAADVRGVEELLLKVAMAGQQLAPDKIDDFKKKASDQIKSLSTMPVIITAISGVDKVDVRGGNEQRTMVGVPSILLASKAASGLGSAVAFLKQQYGPFPLWGWSLIGVGAIGVGVFILRRK